MKGVLCYVAKISTKFHEFFQKKIMVGKIRLLSLYMYVIVKTPSSVQNCHEVNQSCTLPILLSSLLMDGLCVDGNGR